MSLVRIALRTAVVEALRGRTIVGGNVLDSRIGVIDVGREGVQTDQTKPFIAVYTGAGSAEGDDLRGLVANGETWLLLELGVTAAMAMTDPETDESHIVPGIPVTDDGLELTLDLIARDISNVLTDPDNAWAEIYRGLITRIVKVETEPLRAGDDGQRLAARQIRIAMDLIDDPVRGDLMAKDGALGPFLDALDAKNDVVATSMADLIRDALGPMDGEGWRQVQRRRGLTRSELLAVGIGPLPQDLERSTPVFEAGRGELDGSVAVEVDRLGWIA